MHSKAFVLYLIIILSLLAFSAKSNSLAETFEELEKTILNRMIEVDIDIFNDFRLKYKC